MRSHVLPLTGLLLATALITLSTPRLTWAGEPPPESSQDLPEPSEEPYYDVKLVTGFDFATGTYGTDSSTDIWYVPFTTRLEGENHAFKLTVPFLSITDSGGVVGGGDQLIVVGDGSGERRTENGLGDVIGSFSYYLYPGSDVLPMIDLTYKAKFPTADEDRGLGTGKFDSALELDLGKAFGRITAFSTIAYKWFGNPSDYDLNDVFYGSIGAQYKVNEVTQLGLIYDIRDNTTDAADGISEITAYLGTSINERWKLMLYGVAGLSDASPDWGVGLTLTRSGDLHELRDLLPL